MEFVVDKPFYDSDLKELWDSDLEPTINDVFKTAADADLDWSGLLQATPSVILHDRLMTEASIGHPAGMHATPIKAEHSYCSLGEDTDSTPDSELSLSARMDDMEEECYPCIPMKNATRTRPDSESSDVSITVKDEPMSESEPSSPESSCPMSPGSPPPSFQEHKTIAHTSSSHPQSLLKQPTVLVSRSSVQQSRVSVLPKLNIKVEPGFSLPPTPPSSTTSDSEGNDHHPSSPSSRQSAQVSSRLLVSPPPSTSTRQPIQTSLISSQPKGSTGMLLLTEEEKRTLLAEGYPIPTRLPLTKAEEKSLKKIRRKIKNKISAQESRRKKKEYMDALERKVEILQSENSDYRKKIENLEDSNDSLINQLSKLQSLAARASSGNPNALAALATAAATFSSRNSVRHSESLSHGSLASHHSRSSAK
ncbi:cyclic AMP response element-binding protein A-like isoform X2 [Thrips palmi]|uniref:Cyclic AMP response element-binding protein A-like isoform X2 n=1 Tax=Thrips palmi TaxID=161013 RepID=A0A6P8YVI6_THRPL|nr:cyclic AMP response element-binding protein A-like isoform X2 [Thrips palmi]